MERETIIENLCDLIERQRTQIDGQKYVIEMLKKENKKLERNLKWYREQEHEE